MSEVWITIAALVLASAVIRASGPVLLGGRDLPDRFQAVIALIAPAVLAALVVVQTFSAPEGGRARARLRGSRASPRPRERSRSAPRCCRRWRWPRS